MTQASISARLLALALVVSSPRISKQHWRTGGPTLTMLTNTTPYVRKPEYEVIR